MSSTLTESLIKTIRREGKITFWHWMHQALYHPCLGYYTRDGLIRWGREGDYRTSPERSELFAATFARFFVSLFERMGSPNQFRIVEFGAGNRKFALSVLNKLKTDYPKVFEAVHYTIVEMSNETAAGALGTLSEFAGKIDHAWPLELQSDQSCIVFSNEFLDALAVHRVRKVDGKLKEFYVGLNEREEFVWLLDELSEDNRAYCDRYLPDLAEGQTVELHSGIEGFFALLESQSINGYVVTVDYGAEGDELYNQPHRFDGTLRAYKAHQFVDDILRDPGAYDITSTIDWGVAKSAGKQRGLLVEEFEQLDKFLLRVGILNELEKQMTKATNEAERASLTTAAREMILPGGMASSFQVLVQKRG